MNEELLALFKGWHLPQKIADIEAKSAHAIELLNLGADPNQRLATGWKECPLIPILELAIMNRRSELALALIAKGADIFVPSHGYGFSLLDQAIVNGLVIVAECLIDRGIATGVSKRGVSYGEKSLELAIIYDRFGIVKKLIEGRWVSIKSHDIKTAEAYNRGEILNYMTSKIEAGENSETYELSTLSRK